MLPPLVGNISEALSESVDSVEHYIAPSVSIQFDDSVAGIAADAAMFEAVILTAKATVGTHGAR